jgi:tripartite-type tricarboxylate transporter receptor subunit TctC
MQMRRTTSALRTNKRGNATMKFAATRRSVVLAAAIAISAGAQAQSAEYPSQRITFVVGFAAGGFADTMARWVATRLGERTGQTVIVQNMEGGGGIRATRRVVMSPPDGYTILVTTTSLAINESLVPDRGYSADALEAVALPVSAPESLSVSAKSPIKTVADLVREAKAGGVFMGSAGIGTGSHIAGEYFFKVLAKTPVKHIPFPGGNPAMMGLLTGDVTVLAATATALVRRVDNGEVTGLGIAAAARTPMLPSVPTLAEGGYPGLSAASWTGFFAPAGTPEPVLAKLNDEINAIMKERDIAKRIEAAGLDTTVRGRAETAKLFRAEIESWSAMVRDAGVTKP